MDNNFFDRSGGMAFVTGATGLVGQEIVKALVNEGIGVVAQSFSSLPQSNGDVKYIKGDFSSLDALRGFIEENGELLGRCNYLINNYGPMTWKDSQDILAEDFMRDFQGNFITASELTGFMLKRGKLDGVVTLGFENIGEIKAYKKILSYGVAKNSLLLYIEGMRMKFGDTFFSIVSPSTVRGAEFESAGTEPIEASEVAELIVRCLKDRENRNFIINHKGVTV